MFVNAGVFGKHGAAERYRDTWKIICLARYKKNRNCSDINIIRHLLPVIIKYAKLSYNTERKNSSLR